MNRNLREIVSGFTWAPWWFLMTMPFKRRLAGYDGWGILIALVIIAIQTVALMIAGALYCLWRAI